MECTSKVLFHLFQNPVVCNQSNCLFIVSSIDFCKYTNLRKIIKNLYWNQKAAIRVENTTYCSPRIQRGVRQGCTLSPLRFNIYLEDIFKKVSSDNGNGNIVIHYVHSRMLPVKHSQNL